MRIAREIIVHVLKAKIKRRSGAHCSCTLQRNHATAEKIVTQTKNTGMARAALVWRVRRSHSQSGNPMSSNCSKNEFGTRAWRARQESASGGAISPNISLLGCMLPESAGECG